MGSFYHKVKSSRTPPLFAFIFTQPKWSKELLGVTTGPNIYKVQFKKSGWHSILLAKTLFIHSQSQFELLLSNIWSKCHGCSSVSTPNFNPKKFNSKRRIKNSASLALKKVANSRKLTLISRTKISPYFWKK